MLKDDKEKSEEMTTNSSGEAEKNNGGCDDICTSFVKQELRVEVL
jgi:hypothetical protein